MIIGLLKEPAHETRVSLLAEAVATLTKKGITVIVENGAGEKAFCSNADYEKAGASIDTRENVISRSDIILSIHQPLITAGNWQSKILVGVYQPLFNKELMQQWAAGGATIFSLDMFQASSMPLLQ